MSETCSGCGAKMTTPAASCDTSMAMWTALPPWSIHRCAGARSSASMVNFGSSDIFWSATVRWCCQSWPCICICRFYTYRCNYHISHEIFLFSSCHYSPYLSHLGLHHCLLFNHDSIIAIHEIRTNLTSHPLVKLAPLTTSVSLLPLAAKLQLSNTSFYQSSPGLLVYKPTNHRPFLQLQLSPTIAIPSLTHRLFNPLFLVIDFSSTVIHTSSLFHTP